MRWVWTVGEWNQCVSPEKNLKHIQWWDKGNVCTTENRLSVQKISGLTLSFLWYHEFKADHTCFGSYTVVNSTPVPQRQRSMSQRHLSSFMALVMSTARLSVNSPYYQWLGWPIRQSALTGLFWLLNKKISLIGISSITSCPVCPGHMLCVKDPYRGFL